MLLVRRSIAGDERAMRALWAEHSPQVDRLIRRLAGDPELAKDIAQEVWVQVFRALPSFRGDSQFSTWLHRIVVNRTLNAMRVVRRINAAEVSLGEYDVLVDHESERTLLVASIEEAARRLSPGARAVFVLHDVQGYSHEEIASELGITAGGSRSQLFKARMKLRRLLAPLVESGTTTVEGGYATR